MARPVRSTDNPNYYFGCHPLPRLDELGIFPNDQKAVPAISFSRFPSASILDGVITWKRCRTQRRRALDNALERIIRGNLPGEAHVLNYLNHLYRRNCKPNTIKNASITIGIFLKYAQKRGREHLAQITRRDLEAFVEHEQDRGMKANTIRFRIQSLYGFFRFLLPEKVIHPDLLTRKIKIKLPQSLPRAMAPCDEIKLITAIDHTRDRAMILMLLRTGMRIGELLNLRVNDVDVNERTVKIYEGEKNSVGRVCYISDDAREALRAWLTARNERKSYLFYGRYGPLGYTIVRERFIRYLHRAGLSNKRYTLHSLRHTFATDLLNAGMRLECLQQLLGHSKLEVTRIYAKLSDATREEEYFRAMAKIEKGETNGAYGLDCEF
jgi:integrase/recombinase XerD